MSYQSTFRRREIKYLLTKQDKDFILETMKEYMKPDHYGRTVIRNVYFDTDRYRLIRRSLEKPVYKEKLRIRSYCRAEPEEPVFVELKKKYKSVVYKRRILLPQKQVMESFDCGLPLPGSSQIIAEIEYFRSYYKDLFPKVFLSYEREAFSDVNNSGLRITFDENILYRNKDLSLSSAVYGQPLLREGDVLMEIKTAESIPLWLCHILTQRKIYQTSFSKYGNAYHCLMMNQMKLIQRRDIYVR